MSRIDYVLSAVLLAGLYLSGSGSVPEDPAEAGMKVNARVVF